MKRFCTKTLGLTVAAGMIAAMLSVNTFAEDAAEKIVNIGITDSLGGMNSLTNDQTWINKYATDLEFLPLVDLDQNLDFEGRLADSVSTEDNLHFTVHLKEDAVWSDGEPITAEDVEFTLLKMASPVIGNATFMLYAFEGVGDDGFVEAGAESIEGVKIIDEKTVEFSAKYPLALTTFENTYASYMRVLPKHVLAQYSDEELMTLEWFNHPDVVSGPYRVVDFDVDHYISYEANDAYWMGAPKIGKLNFKIVDSSQILSGLQSGEIDMTHHTMTAIPEQDYESIEALENVDVVYGSPVTNQTIFIQTANLPDARVREALLCSIDRQMILDQLMQGHGEVVDGFVSSASPFFDESVEPVEYDPARAEELLADADWDSSRTLVFYVNSGDGTFVNAAQVMVAQWAAVGIKAEVRTVDLATLMTVAGTMDYDLFAVQYTYAPVDPYPDVAWLLGGEGSWTSYGDDEVNAALEGTQTSGSVEEIRECYRIVDQKMQEDVPMFSAYVISAQGAVNKRLSGVNADVYGVFNNIQEWDIVE